MWKIKNLEYRKSDGLVVAVIAECTITSGNLSKTHTILVDLPEPNGDMTPFNELTEVQVLTWVHNNHNTSAIEVKITEELDFELAKEFDLGKPW